MSIKPSERQRGVTMVELIMFMVIIGIAMAGILQVMTMTTANSADPLVRKQGLMIAEGLLEEVRLAQFTFCDPTSDDEVAPIGTAGCNVQERWGREAGTSNVRPYDNVNDYVNAANTPVAAFNDPNGILIDAAGRPIDVRGYGATVTIVPAAIGANGIGADNPAGTADADALRIRVTVTVPGGGDPVVLDGYRARYAPRLQ